MQKLGIFTPKQGLFLVLMQITNSRKYDVEFEARKIYGQDLKAVIERFRRTPDYIQILNDEIQKIYQNLEVNIAQTSFYYMKKLKAKVYEVINDNFTNPRVLRLRTTTGEYYTKYIGPRRKPIVRQHTHNMSGVERLEQYGKLNPSLPVNVRNSMVELGFEYCGYAIHGIIKSISPEGLLMSTLQASDASQFTTHYSHKITSVDKEHTTDEEKTTNSNFYRNFKQNIKHV